MKRTFLESPNFPIREINEKSAKEKGPARPPYWEMVFWWTRKPLIGARAVIAGALLPENVDAKEFKKMIRLNENTPHRFNPQIPDKYKQYFEGKKLLDPFAGFGSIPLEGLRLGLDVTAVELLPTAYVFLKAVLEYPKKFGRLKVKVPVKELEALGLDSYAREAKKKIITSVEVPALVYDVAKWGNWITEQLKNDPEIRELYDDDVAVYIGTWEVKCPHCGKWTPIVGNWWLARVKDSKGKYQRLAYMKPKRTENGIEIEVVDLNQIVGDVSNAKVDTRKGEIVFEDEEIVKKLKPKIEKGEVDAKIRKIDGKEAVVFEVPKSNMESRRQQAFCLNCGNVMRFVDESGNHYTRKKGEGEFYVKFALRKYHQGDENYARQRLLVKVKIENNDLIFEPATKEDNAKLEKAKEKVKELLKKGDPDIPREPVPPYGSLLFGALQIIGWGFDQWYKLFNPRQLLTLVKIVKLIREVGKKVEEEKLKEGWSEEEAFKYAEAIATYLSVAQTKIINYNTLSTRWSSGSLLPNKVQGALSFRGIAMVWNWGDTNVLYIQGNSYSISKATASVMGALNYLISSLAPNLHTFSKVEVMQSDATSLSFDKSFDVIVTDPPYSIDVPYAELSDFYYVWLKRALSDVEGNKLVPRFHREAFFKKVGKKYREREVQWKEFASKEVSEFSARFYTEKEKEKLAKEHFKNLFTQAFIAMKNNLKDDGILATYYAHTSLDAWATLIEAGWQGAKLQITTAIPLNTELGSSIMRQGKLSLDTSIIAVWRKVKRDGKKVVDVRDFVEYKDPYTGEVKKVRFTEKIQLVAEEKAKQLLAHGYTGLDLLYGVIASALSVITEYEEVQRYGTKLPVLEILEKYVYPASAQAIAKALAQEVHGRVSSKEALFYLLAKLLFGKAKVSSNDVVLLSIATETNSRELISSKILLEKKEGSSKYYQLNSPQSDNLTKLEAFLKSRGIDIASPKPKNAIDTLHLLEYYAKRHPKSEFRRRYDELKQKYQSFVEEATNLALIFTSMAKNLRWDDVEFKLAEDIAEKLELIKKPQKTLMEIIGS
ncbi:hypothetical protein A3L04_08525 [Thermococcus chitonophagus]|uniref:Function Code: 16.1 Conserved Hypothetical n=1 Tax=Thermococcus chitonophagus TaxID=54262 RepID=A0A170SJH1_9EURY|nr:DUF1156 domain-containing protein [Thermococcus chitonophagus]ASJ17110.1 hypothetical protein A3L04_08525 [Thermococcus chitonophagus]CUX77714.1 Function Code: 16.1 Conserved Hypothetical [Thermococcus chitonophagus]